MYILYFFGAIAVVGALAILIVLLFSKEDAIAINQNYVNEYEELYAKILGDEDAGIKLPQRNNPTDAGLDLFSPQDCIIPAGEGLLIPLSIAIELPEGTAGIISDRSSMGVKGIKVMGGVVDEAYRGEIKAMLWNLSNKDYEIKKGDKIAQLIIYKVQYSPVVATKTISSTDRGSNGFGSSGR